MKITNKYLPIFAFFALILIGLCFAWYSNHHTFQVADSNKNEVVNSTNQVQNVNTNEGIKKSTSTEVISTRSRSNEKELKALPSDTTAVYMKSTNTFYGVVTKKISQKDIGGVFEAQYEVHVGQVKKGNVSSVVIVSSPYLLEMGGVGYAFFTQYVELHQWYEVLGAKLLLPIPSH